MKIYNFEIKLGRTEGMDMLDDQNFRQFWKLAASFQKFPTIFDILSEASSNLSKIVTGWSSSAKLILRFNVYLWTFLEISLLHVSIISFSFDFGDIKNRYCLECIKLLVCSWNRTLFMFMFYIYEAFVFVDETTRMFADWKSYFSRFFNR